MDLAPDRCWRNVQFGICARTTDRAVGLCPDHLEELKTEADLTAPKEPACPLDDSNTESSPRFDHMGSLT